METFGEESPSYSTVKKWAADFKRGEIALRMMGGVAAPKMHSLMKMSRSCTPWLSVKGGENSEAQLAKWA